MKADTILKSKCIFDSVSDLPFEGIVAIKGNRICFVGNEREIESLSDSKTKIHDLNDQTIMPGFCDSHIHGALAVLYMKAVNLNMAKSEEEAAKIIYEYYRNSEEKWLFGYGWFHYDWKDPKIPTKHSLDKLFPNKPVFVFNEEAHSAWVNSCAIDICKEQAGNRWNEVKGIERDEQGNPTGYIAERSAMKLFVNVGLKEKPLIESEFEALFRIITKAGVTSVSDMNYIDMLNSGVYEKLQEHDRLKIRLHFLPSLNKDLSFLKRLKLKHDSDKLRFSGVKGFLDGTAMSYTGYLIDEYSDRKGFYGEPLIEPDELNHKVLEMHKEEIRVRLHACGDGAVRLGLNAFENAAKKTGEKKLRHTIEHIENIHPDDLGRFHDLGVIASVQPEHLMNTEFNTHPFHKILGQERCRYAWAFNSLIHNGASIAFGTDFPLTPIDPFIGIYRAMTRRHEDGLPKDGWNPQERLSLSKALKAYTIDSAYQMFREKDIGTLEAGKFADIVILDKNIFKVKKEEIREVKVESTIFDGKAIEG